MAFLEGNYSCLRPVWEKYKQEIGERKKPKTKKISLATSVLLYARLPKDQCNKTDLNVD